MPVSDLHARVASVALAAAAEHGFALGGGNALLAHEPGSAALRRVLPRAKLSTIFDSVHTWRAAVASSASLRSSGG